MDFQTVVFFFLSAILIYAALRVITARNPVHAALHLMLAFFTSGGIWALLQAEFLAIAIILVYVGAVMVLFLFVIMMLDINIDRIRQGFWNYLPLGAMLGILMVMEMGLVLGSKYFQVPAYSAMVPAGISNTKAIGCADVHRFRLSVRTGVHHPDGRHDRGDRPDLPRAEGVEIHQSQTSRSSSRRRIVSAYCRCRQKKTDPGAPMLTLSLSHFLILGAILFAISVVGIFLNRKNLIVLLMAIELMLLAVNMNFVAFSHYLQDLSGQIFVFFILTVAAGEAAIGLAILIVLFRNLKSIHVDDLGSLKG